LVNNNGFSSLPTSTDNTGSTYTAPACYGVNYFMKY
jgi:hypothetical protein